MLSISIHATAVTMLAILAAVTLFHALVVTGRVPTTIVWGGRFTDPVQARKAEVVSILIVLLAAAVVVCRRRSRFERLVFTPVTAVLTLLALRLALEHGGGGA
jgi:hypothetical protein